MKILMLSVATGKYDRFIDPLYQSIQENFFERPRYFISLVYRQAM